MQICPDCETRFPTGHTHCDHDGSLLITDTTRNEKASLDVSISESAFDSPLATAAESPSGRQRTGGGTAQETQQTLYDNGTRLSVGTPPPMPREPAKSEGAKRRDEAKIQAESRVGEVLGSYRLQSVLGLGGMGAVYSAEHLKLGRKVALKLLHNQYAARREAVVRFFQEAQAVNRIRHKNIVDVTDLVELPDGTVFIIMELLTGESLGHHLRTVGLLGTGPTISVLIQICDALQAAHSVDIVHRDLKPDNIFLTTTDEGDLLVKLLDFGVAKLVGKDSEIGVKTAAGSVVGTPAFMSPEQAGALQIDRRSDIYSLGAIMYQLFTGQHVFRGKSFGDYMRLHLNQEPLAPRQTPGGISMDAELEAIIMRCLQKSPSARFQSAAELREALVGYFETFASRVGGVVEGESGVYRLSGVFEGEFGPPPIMAAPPSTLHSVPVQAQAVPVETALMVGDLPGAKATKRSPLLIAAVAATAAISVIAISLAINSRGAADSSPEVTIDAAPPRIVIATPLTIDAAPEAKTVSVRIESNVLARVFEHGAEGAKCGTPCQIELDPQNDPRRRLFTIRAEGYGDGVIEVDLDEIREVYSISLDALEPVIAKDGSKGKGTNKGGGASKGKDTNKGGGASKGKDTNKGKGADKGSSNTSTANTGKGSGSGAVPADKTLNPFKRNKGSR